MNGSGAEKTPESSLSSGTVSEGTKQEQKALTVVIGMDSRKPYVSLACARSIKRFTANRIPVEIMDTGLLRRVGVYFRQVEMRGRQAYDAIDGKPFSTDFSFSRFLVPALFGQSRQWVAFCDDDFLWRESPDGLIPLLDETKAVMVVKHDFNPSSGIKMDGQIQQPYKRKNWSSLILWNLRHPSNRSLTVGEVNSLPGSALHGFGWLKDEEIGSLPERWNWLEGHSSVDINPAAVHYTRGGPWLSAYRDSAFANEWLDVHFSSLNDIARDFGGRKTTILAYGL